MTSRRRRIYLLLAQGRMLKRYLVFSKKSLKPIFNQDGRHHKIRPLRCNGQYLVIMTYSRLNRVNQNNQENRYLRYLLIG